MTTNVKALIAILVAIIIGLLYTSGGNIPTKLGGSINYPAVESYSTSTAVTVTTSNTMVQATTSRTACIISNDSARAVYLSLMGGNPATNNTGVVLQASSTLTLSSELATAYYGAIFGISPAGNANVTVVCY